MSYTAPEEKLHSSETSHETSAASSSGRPRRRIGMSDTSRSRTSGAVSAFIGVSNTAGATELTMTPVVASSLARALVSAITAAFDAEYALRFGLPSLPAIDARLTIRPQPRSTMPGTTARHRWKVPSTLTSKVRRHSSSDSSQSGRFGPTTPALLTRTSTVPTAATARSTCSVSATSTRWSAPSARSRVTTRRPSARSRSTQAAPRPLIPPVTTAVRTTTEPPCSMGYGFLVSRVEQGAQVRPGVCAGLARAQPPVDGQYDPGDERRVGGGEEGDHGGDLVGTTGTPQCIPVAGVVEMLAADEPRGHGVDADALPAELEGQHADQGVDATLRRCVGRYSR